MDGRSFVVGAVVAVVAVCVLQRLAESRAYWRVPYFASKHYRLKNLSSKHFHRR